MQEIRNGKSGFNAPAVVLGGLALIICVLALSLFLQGGFLAARAQEQRIKVLEPVNETLQAALAEHQALLQEGPRWLDEERTRACIPIEAAMDRLVERERGGPAAGSVGKDRPEADGKEEGH